MGAPPPRVAALVWAGSGSALRALFRGWEKSRVLASPRANLTQCGISTP